MVTRLTPKDSGTNLPFHGDMSAITEKSFFSKLLSLTLAKAQSKNALLCHFAYSRAESVWCNFWTLT